MRREFTFAHNIMGLGWQRPCLGRSRGDGDGVTKHVSLACGAGVTCIPDVRQATTLLLRDPRQQCDGETCSCRLEADNDFPRSTTLVIPQAGFPTKGTRYASIDPGADISPVPCTPCSCTQQNTHAFCRFQHVRLLAGVSRHAHAQPCTSTSFLPSSLRLVRGGIFDRRPARCAGSSRRWGGWGGGRKADELAPAGLWSPCCKT